MPSKKELEPKSDVVVVEGVEYEPSVTDVDTGTKKTIVTEYKLTSKAEVWTRFDVRAGCVRVCKMVGDTVVDEARYSEPVKADGDVTILRCESLVVETIKGDTSQEHGGKEASLS